MFLFGSAKNSRVLEQPAVGSLTKSYKKQCKV